jgi:hypothetical protein
LVSQIEEELKHFDMEGIWHLTSGWCDVDCVRQQLSRAKSQGVTVFNAPWPEGDQASRGRVGSNYSGDRLLLRASVVYRKALVAYRQIVEEWFSPLAPRLKTYVLLPFRMVGVVVPFGGPVPAATPSLSWYREPIPFGDTPVVDFKLCHRDDFQPNDEFFRRQKALLAARRPGAERWIHPTFHSGGLAIFDSHPIRTLAYGWLRNDLAEIDWVK